MTKDLGLFTQAKGINIFEEDCEEVKIGKRSINERAMTLDHQRGADVLPLGIPETCHVDQVEYMEEYDGEQGDTQFFNGCVRQKAVDGMGKFYYECRFAGIPREEFLRGEREEKADQSLGTNTLDLEGRLRYTKQKLGYKEPERRRNRSGKGGRPKTKLD